MKTIDKLKCLTVVSAFTLLAGAAPAFAQNTVGSDPAPVDTQMREPAQTDGMIMDEPAGADNSRNWSWVGLLGLAGLFGLKRHNDVRDETYRPARP